MAIQNNDKSLDILIVEDKEEHLSTIPQLTAAGHRVEVARDFYTAAELLGYHRSEISRVKPRHYDAVLTDLMFPFGSRLTGPFDGDPNAESPLGFTVALYAVKKGVPLVAVVTDQHHHSGPLAQSLDVLYQSYQDKDGVYEGHRHMFRADNSRLAVFDIRDFGVWQGKDLYLCPDGIVRSVREIKESDPDALRNPGYRQVKNWKAALDKLCEGA